MPLGQGPLRFKFWVVRDATGLKVVRARFGFMTKFTSQMVDGPFDKAEDAAKSLDLWRSKENPVTPVVPVDPAPVPQTAAYRNKK